MYALLGLVYEMDHNDFTPSCGKGHTLKTFMRRLTAVLIRRRKCPEVLSLAGMRDGKETATRAFLVRGLDWFHSLQDKMLRRGGAVDSNKSKMARKLAAELQTFPS